ncbi:hypothetical protein CCMSSC00406_0000788 [Pleurotus cornucopiae]|uniref:Uncharacterized protein n=1 Tax=Pleurotus cornucopiae TaxID=5321 RepID=A0ACB7JC32_PLECO|nr:hypothetical protein CCMSSC00406_0000788 [Pleurotus cornucopiae]
MSLPIIDIGPFLKSSDPSVREATAAEIHSACLNYGFFYLNISAYADPSEPEELTTLARSFFSLAQEEKDKISLGSNDKARGYARLKENVTNGKADNHEGIDFYRPVENPDKSKPLWGENLWPTIPAFKEKYEQWIGKMKALGLIVMEAMALGLGMTPDEWQQLRGQVDDSFWVMRIIGYPPLPTDHDGFSCGAHRDYGCLTFLYADPTPNALQVFLPKRAAEIINGTSSITNGLPSEEGGEEGVWITADPIPGCVVCNIGEMWEIWTNGLYRSTLHRVIHRSSNYRVSIPFFFEPNFDANISPLAAAARIKSAQPSTVPNGETKEYKPVVYGKFLLGKVTNNFAGGSKYD